MTLEGLLIGGDPLIIDLGYGAYPWTALEMHERLWRFNPRLRLLGVEIAPERVAVALPYGIPGQIDFRLGGFNLTDVLDGERARLIRAFNVLRQYDESEVESALTVMAGGLEEGGVLIEGTCNPTGRIAVFDLYQKVAGRLTHRELVFATNFRAPAEPEDFRAILPKRLIHHAFDPGVAAFFNRWQRAFVRWGTERLGRQWVLAAHDLREGYPIPQSDRLLRRGFLTLRSGLR